MSNVDIYSTGLVATSVCAPMEMSRAAVEEEVNRLSPTGISYGWKVVAPEFATGEPNPHPCELDSDRNHWLLNC